MNGADHPDNTPSNGAPVDKKKPRAKPIPCFSASEILDKHPDKKPSWIVKDLIQEGDQVVLSGPPKSGKTILALQLALAVAKGDHPFLDPKNYRTTEPGIVLFISLEMKPAAIADRLRLQTDPALLKAVGTNLRFLFGLPN
jgi:RecA-family ATPase